MFIYNVINTKSEFIHVKPQYGGRCVCWGLSRRWATSPHQQCLHDVWGARQWQETAHTAPHSTWTSGKTTLMLQGWCIPSYNSELGAFPHNWECQRCLSLNTPVMPDCFSAQLRKNRSLFFSACIFSHTLILESYWIHRMGSAGSRKPLPGRKLDWIGACWKHQ